MKNEKKLENLIKNTITKLMLYTFILASIAYGIILFIF